jgi:DNA-binding IclR family transcriptional regulator
MNEQLPRERGSAFDKALRVLACVANGPRAIGLAELSELMDMRRPTLHRILQQLTGAGLIVRSPERDRYCVGPAMMQISISALTSMSVALPVRAVLNSLVQETGETCNVGILDQDEIVYIERVEGTSPLRLHLQVGSRVPVHCTSIGKLLVAEQHKNVRTRLLTARPLPKFTEATLTDPTALEEEFTNIRANGFSFNNQEFERGLTAMAVAIKNRQKKTVAGLAVHAPSPRMNLETALTYLPVLQEKAKQISDIWAI